MIRQATWPEIEKCAFWLRCEGLSKEDIYEDLKPENVYVFLHGKQVIGFYTLSRAQNRPYLAHFYIDVLFRSNKRARVLIRDVVKRVQGMGETHLILHTRANTERFVKYYFKTNPYAETEKGKFYLVEV